MPIGDSHINYYNSQDNKVFDRELFNNDMFDLLHQVNRLLNSDSTVDLSERYTAVVLDNNDPEKLGRVKANVYGLFDNITDISALPWCVPELESVTGDQYIIPEVGQLIRVIFMDGDIYKPLYSHKVKTPMIFGGDNPSSKCTTNIDADPVNQMVLFENQFSSLQYNKKTNQLLYKNSSGMTIQISGNSKPGEGGQNKDGALLIKVGGSGQKDYSLKIDESGAFLADGQNNDNFIAIDSKMNKITSHSKAHNQMSSGDASLSFDGLLRFGYASTGQVVPDPSGMGPFNALPVDPMTGLPHSGNIFIVSGASKDAKVKKDLDSASGKGYAKYSESNIEEHK